VYGFKTLYFTLRKELKKQSALEIIFTPEESNKREIQEKLTTL
jgi:hypothetical protein